MHDELSKEVPVISTVKGSSGVIENFTTYETMSSWKAVLDKHFDSQTINQTHDPILLEQGIAQDDYWEVIGKTQGVDRKHKGYLWFKKVILDKIQLYFDKPFMLMYAHWADSAKPLVLHQDNFPKMIPMGYTSYASMLIPYTVEHQLEDMDRAATVICSKPGTMTQAEYNEHLSHNHPTCAEKYSIEKIYHWKTGNLIWWDNEAWHGSNNFTLTAKNKQALVIHTYA